MKETMIGCFAAIGIFFIGLLIFVWGAIYERDKCLEDGFRTKNDKVYRCILEEK